MLLFIEGYPYNLSDTVRNNLTVRDMLKNVISVPVKEDRYAFEYVGYCYSKSAKDVIFFLPKVVLTGEQNEESGDDTIFGASPQEIIDFDSDKVKSKFTEDGCKEYKEFLSTLSIWVYRTISVYKQTHNENILESKEYQAESRGRKQKHNTLLDVIIALRDFNKNNQDHFTFVAKNVHSGYNKINWNKSITSSQAVIQNGSPVYIELVNRKKMVNFDEELLIIYFSILNYIRETHGFSFEINIQYPLINCNKLKKSYIDRNLGCRRLKQIKYKYFSDKALRIWDLCYAFFDREYKISMNRQAEDFLLAKDFDHIFEIMIDTLVGGEDKRELPKELIELKAQDGGIQLNRQFENRLFDRDTLLLCHYDVNFLYVVSLYGRNNKSTQTAWREYVRKEFRSKIQDTLNRLYTFRTIQPREGMDCYQFIQDNFQRLNGKLYRPKTDSNYLVLALLKDEECGIWESLKVKSATVKQEAIQNKDLLDALQTHFHVSNPFELKSELHVNNIDNIGTLNRLPKQEIRNILTGLVRKKDTDFLNFYNHTAKTYTMERIPTSINMMDIEYFLPMVGGSIDGYYKVEKVYFGSQHSKPCMKLNLSTYISLGENRVPIYRTKMQPGELISYELMVRLYEQRI